MKKSFLILVAILVTGLYSFGGTFLGPNDRNMLTIESPGSITYIYNALPGYPTHFNVEADQHFYMEADIYSMSCRDLDLEFQINYSGIQKNVYAHGNNECGVNPGLDYTGGTFEENENISFEWLYYVKDGTASFYLYLYIY